VKKKILIVTECFYPEEFKINDIAFSWAERGFEVEVITLFPSYPFGRVYKGFKNKLFSRETYNGVSIIRLRAITGYKESLFKKILKYLNFLLLGSIVSILFGKKYDYIFGFNMGALTSMFPAVVASKLYKKRLVFWSQDLWPDSIYAYGFKKSKVLDIPLNYLVKYIYRSANSIAITGKGFRKKLLKFVSENTEMHYIPNWADTIEKTKKTIFLGDKNLTHITFAGNIGKVQNLENIIIAFSRLSLKIASKAQLNIIGDGSNLNHLKDIAINNKRIIFHGKQDRADMVMFFEASDFLIVSLLDKPIFEVTVPAKTQTYIAAKKPILGIIKGETEKMINDNKLGICADPSDIEGILKLFEISINMTQKQRDSYTLNNEYLTKNYFNREKTITELLEILTNKDIIP
jgi:glycosyltransferase involved in cell wall biosynthesis